jgi:S-adenosylmethionine synthetase
MIYNPKTYTVESVTAGHPDKVCDQISDAILDECLKQDPLSRVAIEAFGGHGMAMVSGEVTSEASVDYGEVANRVYRSFGYKESFELIVNVVQQSGEIAAGVDTGGAGDQGIMYGYATGETPEFLPDGVVLVHKLTKNLELLRTSGKLPWLRPDGKAQVTMEDGTGERRVKTILVSTQHVEDVTQEQIRADLEKYLIYPLVDDKQPAAGQLEILINPSGHFVVGGFKADTGLTGRKIMVDTYGGLIPHGGGCFSGKDATKVDRSGAYMARFAAKNIVANGLAKECLVSVAYAIGQAEPVMVEAIDETGRELADTVRKHFDFRPQAIIERLGLRRPIFQQTAAYGHFGRDRKDGDFPWEEVIKL